MWIKAAQLLLSLSILITLHEFGHYLAARWFKTRVEKFYLFFDFLFPLPNVLNFAIFKKKIGETEWGLGWFPFGGYVKIAGMVDESMDKEALAAPPQPWEFRSKPAWQRLIIMLGGIIVNFLLGILIYIMVVWTWGENSLPNASMKNGVYCDSLALQAGFHNGDRIVSINNEPVAYFDDVQKKILLDDAHTVEVMREGKIVSVPLPKDFVQTVLRLDVKSLFEPSFPFYVKSATKGEPAEKAGLKYGDRIVRLNKDTIPSFARFAELIEKQKSKPVTLGIIRDGKLDTISLTTKPDGTIGVMRMQEDSLPNGDAIHFETRTYSLGGAILRGPGLAWEKLTFYVKQFKLVFTKEGAKKIGGFGTFGSVFPSSWNWQIFWSLTAFFSLVLAFMNLLPIPALDGGHVLFLLWEMITRRKPSEKALEYAQMAGMVILLALLLYANGNDIYRHFIK